MEFYEFVLGIMHTVDLKKGLKAEFSRDERIGIYRGEISDGTRFFGSVGSPFITVFRKDRTEIITL